MTVSSKILAVHDQKLNQIPSTNGWTEDGKQVSKGVSAFSMESKLLTTDDGPKNTAKFSVNNNTIINNNKLQSKQSN